MASFRPEPRPSWPKLSKKEAKYLRNEREQQSRNEIIQNFENAKGQPIASVKSDWQLQEEQKDEIRLKIMAQKAEQLKITYK